VSHILQVSTLKPLPPLNILWRDLTLLHTVTSLSHLSFPTSSFQNTGSWLTLSRLVFVLHLRLPFPSSSSSPSINIYFYTTIALPLHYSALSTHRIRVQEGDDTVIQIDQKEQTVIAK
jgi:hypothetical protein